MVRPPTTQLWQAKAQTSNKWQLLCNPKGCCETSQEDRDSCTSLFKQCSKCTTSSDFKCKLSSCETCTFCHRVATKERPKTHGDCNKICERCFLCRSVPSAQPVTNVHSVASEAFQSGGSLEWLLSTCHWNPTTHNFTWSFYCVK